MSLFLTLFFAIIRRHTICALVTGVQTSALPIYTVFQSSQVIVEVRLNRHTASDMQRFEQRIAQAPEVTQCYATGGGVDYFLHVRARDIDHYQRFIDDLLLEKIGRASCRERVCQYV